MDLTPFSPTAADLLAFSGAVTRTAASLRGDGGIGTLAEKTIHSTLKNFYSPDHAGQEVRVGRNVADVVTADGIIEIQTRQFYRLRPKLQQFLVGATVRIVHPVAHRTWLCWLDPTTGEISKPRRSPRRNDGYTLFPELYGLRDLVTHPGLSVSLVYLEVEELKALDGYGPDRKRRASRQDRVPLALLARLDLDTPGDYLVFLPDSLGEAFTVKELARAARIPERLAGTTLQVMTRLGTVRHDGNRGRAFLYTRNPRR